MIRLGNILKISLQNVMKTSWRFLEDFFARRLEDVLKTSWRCLQNVLKTFLQDVLKTYGQDDYIVLDQDILKKSWRRLRLRQTYSSWSRRLEDVLKTFSEDEDERRLQEVVKMSSWRRMFTGKVFNLFRLLENETLEMFSMRERHKSKYKFGGNKVCKAER